MKHFPKPFCSLPPQFPIIQDSSGLFAPIVQSCQFCSSFPSQLLSLLLFWGGARGGVEGAFFFSFLLFCISFLRPITTKMHSLPMAYMLWYTVSVTHTHTHTHTLTQNTLTNTTRFVASERQVHIKRNIMYDTVRRISKLKVLFLFL